jgi:hypothetical protein
LKELLKNTKLKEEDFFEIRNRSVKEHYPRLAFSLSNIIISVSELSLANNLYYTYVKDIAEKCSNGIVDNELPSLILISNKQTDKNLTKMSIQETTNKFFQIHDKKKTLFSLFKEIIVVILPSFYDENSEKLFDDKVDQLKTTMSQLLKNQEVERKNRGTLINYSLWCDLSEYIIQKLNENFALHIGILKLIKGPILSLVILPDENIEKKCFKFLETIPLPYLIAKELLIQLLGLYIARDLFQKKIELGTI